MTRDSIKRGKQKTILKKMSRIKSSDTPDPALDEQMDELESMIVDLERVIRSWKKNYIKNQLNGG